MFSIELLLFLRPNQKVTIKVPLGRTQKLAEREQNMSVWLLYLHFPFPRELKHLRTVGACACRTWRCHDDQWWAHEDAMMTNGGHMKMPWWPMMGTWRCHDDQCWGHEDVMMTDVGDMKMPWWLMGTWRCHDDQWWAHEDAMMTDGDMKMPWWLMETWRCHDDWWGSWGVARAD